MGPRKRCYISGPITGTGDYTGRFAQAEELLRGMGYETVNPATISAQFPPMEWEEYMEVAIGCMKVCGSMYQMDGWEKSRGAVVEWHLAEAMGMNILNDERLAGGHRDGN